MTEPTAEVPLITVAICTRNRAAMLDDAARSVLAQVRDNTELLLVDNGSPDGTPGVTAGRAAQPAGVSVWREPQPGISSARNAALKRARGRYVLFFDDDQFAGEGWLAAYQRFLSPPPTERLAGVGGAVLPRFEAPPPAWLHEGYFVMDFGPVARPLTGVAAPGCGNCAYHRERALAVGGFNTALERYEESDLSARLRVAGWEIWALPGAPIHHRIPPDRMRLRWLLGAAFADGRAGARMRLGNTSTGWRWGRLLLAPAHGMLLLLAAAVTVPVRHGQLAARLLQRAARVAGHATELLAVSGGTK